MRPHIRGNAKGHLSSRNKPSFTASKGIFRSTICGKRRTVWQSAIYKSTAIAPGYTPPQHPRHARANTQPTRRPEASVDTGTPTAHAAPTPQTGAKRPSRPRCTTPSSSVGFPKSPAKRSRRTHPPRDERAFTTPQKPYKHRQQPHEHRFFMFFTHILPKKFGSLPK